MSTAAARAPGPRQPSAQRRPRSDFRPRDIAIAVAVAVGVQAGAAVAVSLADLSVPAAAPEIDKGPSVPVKVVPVLDMETPLLKLGGKRDKMKLPDRWVRQTPKPRVEQKAFVSPKASKTVEDIPPPEVKVADAGTEPPPPDAEIAKQVDTELEPTVDAGPVANVDQEGHQDGVAEGTEADPLKARAVDLYLARIAGWFSSRFRVSGSGLPPEELTKHKPRAVIVLSEGQMVSYTLTPSGNPVFDAAARATLESAKGQSLPPPPENYPDLGQKQVSVTFVCRENTCD
ncbi:tonB-like protein [Sorangium cellulosum]|uniref:TonB-like protein n=1 Tax=Sorangium cellulosum TaxID=56 RepID=A0A4P2PUV2_SORCE|nr:energy transducer TonB [Sorangium cellulosum]AUX20281.1 tonB-like protein [Sorangium cellulosum]